jgi:hypothetical protein
MNGICDSNEIVVKVGLVSCMNSHGSGKYKRSSVCHLFGALIRRAGIHFGLLEWQKLEMRSDNQNKNNG